MLHPAFDLKNPNRVYALAADVISELQAINPQVASRVARSLDRWRKLWGMR
jgi:aminopeptidase N